MGSLYIIDVIKTAQKYIGYKEGPNNYNFFAECLDGCDYFAPQKKQNVAWCAIFCDFCVMYSTIPEDRDDEARKYDAQYFLYQPSYNNYSASANMFASYFKNAGAWYQEPKIGDMIFFANSSGISHVGIVENVDGCITTIEGNAGDMVQRKWYDFDDARIAGFGRPRYDGTGGEMPEDPSEDETTIDKTVNIDILVDADESIKVNVNMHRVNNE